MNFKKIALFFLIGSCISINAQEKQLVWEENFDGKDLDFNVWNLDLGDGCPDLCGWGNNEAQVYTNANYKVENGFLSLVAKKLDDGYTSTRINSKNKKEFLYGKIEVRAKLPLGKGLWPAFWMLGKNINEVGWPACGEIDILEYVGREPNKIFTTLHTQDSHGNSKNTRKDEIKGIEEGFHTYAIDWSHKSIAFYIDDQHFYTFEPEEITPEIWPFDQPFYLLLNLAVGGNFGGHDIDDSIFPKEFVIDYIRVYQ
jgi:beta-glucanase (GH16 family)